MLVFIDDVQWQGFCGPGINRLHCGIDLQLQTGSHWIPEEQLLIAEYTSEGDFLDTGEPYANRYVGYWYFEGDRVRRLREYYDPEAPRASALE